MVGSRGIHFPVGGGSSWHTSDDRGYPPRKAHRADTPVETGTSVGKNPPRKAHRAD